MCDFGETKIDGATFFESCRKFHCPPTIFYHNLSIISINTLVARFHNMGYRLTMIEKNWLSPLTAAFSKLMKKFTFDNISQFEYIIYGLWMYWEAKYLF